MWGVIIIEVDVTKELEVKKPVFTRSYVYSFEYFNAMIMVVIRSQNEVELSHESFWTFIQGTASYLGYRLSVPRPY